MQLAHVMTAGRGETDRVLADVARVLAARGLRCCGTVQINAERPEGGRCDMHVQVLPAGPVLRISQDLGQAARGCRLDAAALETAVAMAAAGLEQGGRVLIVNKFGKHESEGRGFRNLIAAALDRGIPVIVGLNELNRPAFDAFAGALSTALAPDAAAIIDWVEAAVALNPA